MYRSNYTLLASKTNPRQRFGGFNYILNYLLHWICGNRPAIILSPESNIHTKHEQHQNGTRQ